MACAHDIMKNHKRRKRNLQKRIPGNPVRGTTGNNSVIPPTDFLNKADTMTLSADLLKEQVTYLEMITAKTIGRRRRNMGIVEFSITTCTFHCFCGVKVHGRGTI